jgi:hypothetical protein
MDPQRNRHVMDWEQVAQYQGSWLSLSPRFFSRSAFADLFLGYHDFEGKAFSSVASSKRWRPLASWSFSLFNRGLTAVEFHGNTDATGQLLLIHRTGNALLHLASSLLVFRATERIAGPDDTCNLPLFASLAFLLNPARVVTVHSFAERPHLLSFIFALYAGALDPAPAFFLLAAACGLLSSEYFLAALPAIVVTHHAVRVATRGDSPQAALRSAASRAVLLAFPTLRYLDWRLHFLGGFGLSEEVREDHPWRLLEDVPWPEKLPALASAGFYSTERARVWFRSHLSMLGPYALKAFGATKAFEDYKCVASGEAPERSWSRRKGGRGAATETETNHKRCWRGPRAQRELVPGLARAKF